MTLKSVPTIYLENWFGDFEIGLVIFIDERFMREGNKWGSSLTSDNSNGL